MSIINYYLEDYDISLRYIEKAKHIVDKEKKYLLRQVYYVCAIIHVKKENIDTAIRYLKLSLDECNNNTDMAYTNSCKKNLPTELIPERELNILVLRTLGTLYHQNNDTDTAVIYYLMALHLGDFKVLDNLAVIHYEKNNFHHAEYYYLKSIDKNRDDNTLYSLAVVYFTKKDKNKAIQYIVMALQSKLNNELINKTFDMFISLETNELKQYYYLHNIDNNIVKQHVTKICKIMHVQIYKRKIDSSSLKGTCNICLQENMELVPIRCFHFFCKLCYTDINRCPYRCLNNV